MPKSKSARKFLTAKTNIIVENFEPLTKLRGVINYSVTKPDGQRVEFDDLYNIADEATYKVLQSVQAGKKVQATIAPDSSTDNDSHPECLAAVIVA